MLFNLTVGTVVLFAILPASKLQPFSGIKTELEVIRPQRENTYWTVDCLAKVIYHPKYTCYIQLYHQVYNFII